MLEEIGTVKSLSDGTAVVLVPRKSACEGCTSGVCKTDEQAMEIEALNTVGAEVGQRVRVLVQPYTFMKGSLIVYGVPALALVLGAIAGKELMPRFFPAADPDLLSAVFGFGTLIASLGAVRLWSQAAGGKADAKPVISEIMH